MAFGEDIEYCENCGSILESVYECQNCGKLTDIGEYEEKNETEEEE